MSSPPSAKPGQAASLARELPRHIFGAPTSRPVDSAQATPDSWAAPAAELAPEPAISSAAIATMKRVGLALVQRSKFEDAERLFAGLHVLAPDDVYVLNALGVLALERADAPAALRVLTRARELAAGSPEVQVNLGEAYLRSGQVDRALDCFGMLLDGNAGRFVPGDPTVRRARVLATAAAHALEMRAARPVAAEPRRASPRSSARSTRLLKK